MLAGNQGLKLHSDRMLTRNVILNFIGQGIPLAVAIFAIPFLIRGLGVDRFGVLTLAWMVIGYFSLFDLGLGRALTHLVAEKLGAGKKQEIPAVVWSAQVLMVILGVSGALVVSQLSPWLVRDILKIPLNLQNETLNSFYLLALSIPLVISTAGLKGILEAHQRFDLTSAVRIPAGIFNFLGPLLVLPFSQNLIYVVAILVIGRAAFWVTHLLLCFHIMPELKSNISVDKKVIKPLLVFGGWMTVSNIVGPLMVYLDRFLIGALISIKAVAYYTTPYEIVTKLWLIPGAMVGVLFPAFSAGFAEDKNRTVLLLSRGIKYVFLLLFPITLMIVTFAREGLTLWLGDEFAQQSTHVLQWLAVGVFINSMAFVPYAMVQAAGRPDLTAKLHLIELPFYLLAVWWMINSIGIEGAAIAWVVRVAIDALILFIMAIQLSPSSTTTLNRIVLAISAVLMTLALVVLPDGRSVRLLFVLMSLFTFFTVAWFFILDAEERALVHDKFKILRSFSQIR